MKYIIKTSRWPVLAVCLYILFHSRSEELLTNLVVEPVLSHIVIFGNPVAVLAYIILIGGIIIWFIRRMVIRYRFSDHWLAWSLIALLFYVYYRCFSNIWQFEPLWRSIKAVDAIIVVPVLLFLARFRAASIGRKPETDANSGFISDDPITIQKNDDRYNRHPFIAEIKKRILQAPNTQSSVRIGIIGPWGSGKTTFINTLKEDLENSSDVIQIYFRPWTKTGSSNLTESFFQELSFQLSRYTDLLHHDVELYGRLLVGNTKPSIGRYIQYFFSGIPWHHSSLENAKSRIQTALEKLGRKMVIYIDDIDRLHNEEIQEVFKFVRNSADFPGVFYILAFDKMQVEDSLNPDSKIGKGKYLEKILQIEFYLPPINRNSMLSNLLTELLKRVSPQEREWLPKTFTMPTELYHASLIWVKGYLLHHRDLVRFLNQFDFHYSFIKGEVYLPDFIALMVLRLRYPEFYYYFYAKQFGILTYKERDYQFVDTRSELTLRGIDERATTAEKTTLYAMLEEGIPEAGIAPKDFGPLEILKEIFESPQPAGSLPSWPVLRTGPKAHLSVRFNRYFARYFDFSAAGRLSDIAFGEALYGSKEVFIQKIREWSADAVLRDDVVTFLERIEELEDVEQFEKVISALLIVADSFETNSNEVIMDVFLNRLRLSKQNRKQLLSIYPSTGEAEAFLIRELTEKVVVGNWCYKLAGNLAAKKEGEYWISPSEAAKVVVSACDKYFDRPQAIDRNFFFYARDWDNNCSRIGRLSPKPVLQSLFLKNWQEGIKMLIGPCEQHYEEGKYLFYDGWLPIIFPDRSALIREIMKIDIAAGEELATFADVISGIETNQRHCASFDFQILPIEKISVDEY